MEGGDGNDTLWAGNAADVLDGGPGNDDLQGRNGADQLLGGPGLDRLNGDAGAALAADTIDGGADRDLVQ